MKNNQKSKDSNNIRLDISIKSFALFLSEFSHLIIILIIVLIGLIFPSHHKSVTYHSKTNIKKWNSTLDPLIFTHISDIHITNYKPIEKYISLFKAVQELNATFHIITGDLVDNYKKKQFPKVGKQNYLHWSLYKLFLNSYLKNKTIIDVLGNHDTFGVINPISKKFSYLDYSPIFNRNNTKNLDEFEIKSIKIEGINFILVNPFIYPLVHPPYGFYPHTRKKLLDSLEKEINKVGPCNIVVHFPIDFFWWKESSNGKSFGKLMKNRNIQYIFSGHTHPSNFLIKHHEYGGLEFIGTSTKTSTSFGLVSLDNGRLVYNKVEYGKNKFNKCYMTHPMPREQISAAQIFNERNTEIRIISYDENFYNNLYVSGDFNGKMEFKRIIYNGAKLYSMPLNITKEGKYEIVVNGTNCYIKRKFYIGNKYKTKKDKKILSKAFFRLLFVSAAIILFFLLIICFPIKIINFHYIDDWIIGLNNKKCYWFHVIFLSPLILNYRININSPLYFRIILFVFLLYSIIFPFHFFEPIEGNVGFTFFCFIYIKHKVIYEEWSIFFNMFYYWGVISPCAILVSGFKFKDSCIYYFNFIFLYFAFLCICAINIRWAGESMKILLLFFHPCYAIIPVILNILIYIVLHNKKEAKNQSSQTEVSLNNFESSVSVN